MELGSKDLDHECKYPLRKGNSWAMRKLKDDRLIVVQQAPAREVVKCGRTWSYGSMHGTKEAMQGWIPTPTCSAAKFLEVVRRMQPVRRKTYYDSAMVSNLSTNKAGYIKHTKYGYILTEKGYAYLRTHKIEVNLTEWMQEHSATGRYKKP
jgi:hypothetical protein